jgi:hypothetical protein
MFDRSVAKVLARCLEDIENGVATVDECLRRHPEQAEELRPHLELHQQLARMQRPEPSSTGEQQGREHLLTAVASHNIREVPHGVIQNLTSSAMARAVAGVLAGAILLTGAASASAAMGGPNVPGLALSALGFADDHNGDGATAGSATAVATRTSHPDATATGTRTGTPHPDASSSPDAQNLFGLCTAWSQGSAQGQQNKQDAPAFKDLIKAAGADSKTGPELDNAVTEFCKGAAKPDSNASVTPSPTSPTTSGTATPSPTQGRGNNGNGNGNGNSNGHPDGRPRGTPTPPGTR